MLTFVLCGIIAGCVLAVVALYVIRRHARSKEKLRQLAGGNPDQLEASKDYQVGTIGKTLSLFTTRSVYGSRVYLSLCMFL